MMHPQMTRCKRTTIGDLCKRPMIGQPLGGAGIYIYIIASHLWQNSGFGKTCWNYRNIVTAPDIYPKRIWEV